MDFLHTIDVSAVTQRYSEIGDAEAIAKQGRGTYDPSPTSSLDRSMFTLDTQYVVLYD